MLSTIPYSAQTSKAVKLSFRLAAIGSVFSIITRFHVLGKQHPRAVQMKMWVGLIAQTLQNVAPLIPITTYSVRWLIDTNGPLQFKVICGCALGVLGLITTATACTPILARAF